MATADGRATSILVIRRGGLGDTLLVLPLLRALRRAHPGARLALAGMREYVDVLHRFGAVDEALSSESLHLWSPPLARTQLARFDLVVGDEPAVSHRALDPTDVQPGVPFGRQLVQQAGLASRWPDDALLAARAGASNGPILFAPGSGGRAKCWPAEHWLELAVALVADAGPPLVVCGPTELEREDPRHWPWPSGTAFVAGVTPVQLADRLATARAFVGNDSGPTHLAAMLGVATVAVFGPTDPLVWGPIGRCAQVVPPAPDGSWPSALEVRARFAAIVKGGEQMRRGLVT